MFKQVVERIFNNWTALKLAVEHSMGGTNSKQIAVDTVNYMVQYCTSEDNLEVEDIEDVLDDIMDQEFNTICEDNSIKEVSHLLYNFMQLLKAGNMTQLELEYNNLPQIENNWISTLELTREPKVAEATSSSQEMEEDFQEDPEWTQVKSRRKK